MRGGFQGDIGSSGVERRACMQWGAALGAGLLAGLVLMVVPRGSPWSSFTFFSPAIVGRALPPDMNMPLPAVWMLRLSIALLYGILISWVVAGLAWNRAVLVGGLMGLLFYLLSTGILAFASPEWRNPAFPVLFAHLVFGLLTGGAYRGLLRRRTLPAGNPVQEE